MPRQALIAAVLVAAVVAVVLISSGGRRRRAAATRSAAIFDNGAFMVNGEEVRVAGATVGTVESVDVTSRARSPRYEDGSRTPVPGKAVIVMKIDDPGFQDFREDASCLIRPQSLIGEKFVDCRRPSRAPRAPSRRPSSKEIPDGEPGEGQLPAAAREQRQGRRPRPDQQHPDACPTRDRFRLILNDLGAGLAARGDDLGEVIDRANPALRETDRVLEILAQQNDQLAQLASDWRRGAASRSRDQRLTSPASSQRRRSPAQATAERGADTRSEPAQVPRDPARVPHDDAQAAEASPTPATPLFYRRSTGRRRPDQGDPQPDPVLAGLDRALKSLGDAGEACRPEARAPPTRSSSKARESGPVRRRADEPAREFLRQHFDEDQGLRRTWWTSIYNATASINGFDKYGHFVRSLVSCSRTASNTDRAEARLQGQLPANEGGASANDSDGPTSRPEAAEPSERHAGSTLAAEQLCLRPAPRRPNRRLTLGEAKLSDHAPRPNAIREAGDGQPKRAPAGAAPPTRRRRRARSSTTSWGRHEGARREYRQPREPARSWSARSPCWS